MFNLFRNTKHCVVQAIVNGREKTLSFRNTNRALDYINRVLLASNLEVTEVIEKNGAEEYYCNDNSRFILIR